METKAYGASIGKASSKRQQFLGSILSNRQARLPQNDAAYRPAAIMGNLMSEDTTLAPSNFADGYPIVCADGVGGSQHGRIASHYFVDVMRTVSYDQVTPSFLADKIDEISMAIHDSLESTGKTGNGSTTGMCVWYAFVGGYHRLKVFNVGDCQGWLQIRQNNTWELHQLDGGPPSFLSVQMQLSDSEMTLEEKAIVRYSLSGNHVAPIPCQIDSDPGSTLDKNYFFSYGKEYGTTEPLMFREALEKGLLYNEVNFEADEFSVILFSDGVVDNISQPQINIVLNSENSLEFKINTLMELALLALNDRPLLDRDDFATMFVTMLFVFFEKFPDASREISEMDEYEFVLEQLNRFLESKSKNKIEQLDDRVTVSFYEGIAIFKMLAVSIFPSPRSTLAIADKLFRFFWTSKIDDISAVGVHVQFS
jgi:serine/threonine protein phosphatase PrpC